MSSYKLLVSWLTVQQEGENHQQHKDPEFKMKMQNSRLMTIFPFTVLTFILAISSFLTPLIDTERVAPAESVQASTCKRELENANRTMAKWGETMEGLVNESKLPPNVREAIHNEANKILDLIEEFGEQIKTRPPGQLAKDLVTIRRRSNRMALDIYLNTFDMRWPQNSLGLGVTVERVQQACLDRESIQLLESPANPLEQLLHHKLS